MEDDASRVIGCNTYLPVGVVTRPTGTRDTPHAFSYGGGLDRDPVETPRKAHSGSPVARAVEPEHVFREGEQSMRAWANGDAAAGHAVYVSFRARVRGRVKQLAPAQDVDDLCQQVWLEVTRCRCDWRGPGVAGWLYTIATRTVHRGRQAPRPLAACPGEAASTVDLERTILAIECAAELEAVKSEAKRAAVRYWSSGETHAEIAKRMGITPRSSQERVRVTIIELRENVRPVCARPMVRKAKPVKSGS